MKLLIVTVLSILCGVQLENYSFGQHNTPTASMEEIAIKGDVIVRLHKGSDPKMVLDKMPKEFDLKINRCLSKHTDIWLFNYEQTANIHEVIENLYRIEEVWLAQTNTLVELRQAPNDPLYGNQWQHQNINSEEAWDITTGGTAASGEDIVVCIIESANVMGHPDLVANHWVNTAETLDGTDTDGNGYIDDVNGWNVSTNNHNIGTGNHGTSVAGMIGAKGNSGVGVAGANWDVKMMVVAGHDNPFTQANIVEAYTYPLDARLLWNATNGAEGAFVVATNASWGIDNADPADYPIWCGFYQDLGEAGILNCGATSNSNVNVDVVGDMPTGCLNDYMVAVTATDINDVKTFAGYGVNSINVAAPGDNIYTTNNSGYGNTSGTSFASPYTAGVIGLMYSIPCPSFMAFVKADPQGAADMVRNALYDGVDQTAQLQGMVTSGGRINAKNSIDLLMDQICSSCTPPSNIQTTTINDIDASISYTGVAEADDYTIYIQEAGSGSWSSFTTAGTTHTFNGLTACTEYEFYIESTCDVETSVSSPIQTFVTTGCGNCIELPYCATTTTNPDIFIGVHSPSGVETEYTGYILTDDWGADLEDGYAYGDLVLVDDGTAAGEEGCGALINGVAVDGNIAVALRGTCNFSLKALNAQNAGATALIVINNQGASPPQLGDGGQGPQITIPVVMVSQVAGANLLAHLQGGNSAVGFIGQQNEWIESFELDGVLSTSGDDGGYRAPSLTHINLDVNTPYSFTLTPGQDGQEMDQYTRIWVDLNQDGVFDVSEIIYDQSTATPGVISDMITIPGTATLGSTRMRVQMAYQGYGSNPLPNVCGTFTSGEVEDYCIELSSGVSCGMTVNSTVTDPTCEGQDNGSISVAVSGGAPGYSYNWGAAGGNVDNISGLSNGNYMVTITDNIGCDTIISYNLAYDITLGANFNNTDVSCNGEGDGVSVVTGTGGTGYSYQWTAGPAGDTYSALDGGNYSVTVTDIASGCETVETTTINEPAAEQVGFTSNVNFLDVNFTNTSSMGTYAWDFGDGVGTSAFTSPSYTYALPGTYTVCLELTTSCGVLNVCNDVTVTQNTAGILSLNMESVVVYPNPSNGVVNFKITSANVASIEIVDVVGKVITAQQVVSELTTFDLSKLNDGTYFYRVKDANNSVLVVDKVMIAR